MTSGKIWLARHGETAANAEHRVQGSIDPPLNDRGREQARELAQRARELEIAALYTSHQRRARETAEIVGEELGLEPRVDRRFAESDRGAWEGRLTREIRETEPEAYAASLSTSPDGGGFRFPGGESLHEHAQRVEEALDDVAEGPLPALVVCHGGTIRRALASRRPEALAGYKERGVPNGSLFAV